MPARDALFWNQVIQTNQFIFSVLRPLIYLTIRQAHFSCLRYTHFSFLYYQYPCQGSQDLVEIKVLAAFVLKREAFTQRIFYQNRQSLLNRMECLNSFRDRWLLFLDQQCLTFGPPSRSWRASVEREIPSNFAARRVFDSESEERISHGELLFHTFTQLPNRFERIFNQRPPADDDARFSSHSDAQRQNLSRTWRNHRTVK